MNKTPLYYLLQSGFVTKDTGHLALHAAPARSVLDRITPTPLVGKGDEFYYDTRITTLFAKWREDAQLVRSFEFREEVLKEAIRVFHTAAGGIAAWMSDQLLATTSSYLHRRFVLDTAGLIYTDVERPTQVHSYVSLLGTKAPSKDSKPAPDYRLDLKAIQNRSCSTVDVELLIAWTTTYPGFTDLLTTLNLIFGKRGDSVR